MKELKRRLSAIENYFFEVCFYESDFIIVRCSDYNFKKNPELMMKLISIADIIKHKYNLKVEYSTLDFYKDQQFEMV